VRLKRVRIFGFKTFADKTEFDLEGDLIALVGPNGCGKSNIVDAILWGLGEPNARNLRAQTSQDVIFSGSARRKPLGFAEVTLLFDNEDGALGIDAPEVTVTRRLTRSGDSEYQINRKTCRLRDIYELLADSGLGRAGYAIVGQKDIDAALAASPEERRAWIDEAAGVQRYRARRVESLKRLDLAQDHLDRIDDILREIEAQREPLREEAERARVYRDLQDQLRSLETGLLMIEIATAVADVADLEARAARSLENAKAEQTNAERLEAEAKAVQGRLDTLEAELEDLRQRRQEAYSALERAQSALELAEHKLAGLDEFEASLNEEAGAAEARLAEARADLDRCRAEEAAEAEALARLEAEVGGGDQEAQALKSALDRIEAELAEAKRIEGLRLRSEAEIAHAKRRRGLARAELEGIERTMPDLEAAIAESEEKVSGLESKRRALDERLSALRDRLEGGEADAAAAHRLREALSERAALDGRRRGLEATIETHEGLSQGARAVVDLAAKGRLKARYVPVAEALGVEPELALAIETALGASAHDLIVEREEDAKRAIELLKAERLGRATFQPIPLMRPRPASPELKGLLREKGVLGIAADLVECRPEHRPVVDSLLGRIVVVEDLDLGLRLAKTSGWSRLVTLAGEVVHAAGAVTGGASARQGVGLVQRQAELTRTLEDLARLDQEIERLKASVADAQSGAEAFRREERSIREELDDLRPELDEAKTWLGELRAEHRAALKSKEQLTNELATLEIQAPEALPNVDVAEIETRRDEALKALAARLADAAQGAERLQEARHRFHQAETRRIQAEKRLANLGEGGAHRERRLATLDQDRAKARESITHHRGLKDAAEALGRDLDARLEQAAGKKRDLTERIVTLREQAAEAQRNAAGCADLAHQAELARAKADARRSAALQRLLEEYGFTQEDALREAPGLSIPDDAAITVARLRREIRGMGEVNLGAIEAYERLTERYGDLFAQREDVVEGKAEVEAGIRELDRATRDRFETTFEAVRVAFGETFTRLFGGGEGDLRLSHPDDLLATGVEVDVTVPGKKRQRLELLSGGERSMSAIAFLFALLKVKPSPLVVLDEVDAPLDGRNVERFIEILRDFAGTSQFMLITHNPVTIENAEVWFGVTMQEPGVSTLVPCRVPEPKVVAEVVPSAFLKG
jgi:chromosome segregation protein